MYVVRAEHVKPARVVDYEDQTRRWLADAASELGDEVQWTMIYGSEIGYAHVAPVSGFAQLDRLRGKFPTGNASLEDRWDRLPVGQSPPVEWLESYVLELRPDLSYLPRTVDFDPTLPFRKYHWYHLIPGRQSAFEDIARQLVSLYGRHGIEQGFRIYEVLLGQDLPIFVLVERAEDEVDYASRAAGIRMQLGGLGDALFGRVLEYTRHLEVNEGMTRGELSYPPIMAETSEQP